MPDKEKVSIPDQVAADLGLVNNSEDKQGDTSRPAPGAFLSEEEQEVLTEKMKPDTELEGEVEEDGKTETGDSADESASETDGDESEAREPGGDEPEPEEIDDVEPDANEQLLTVVAQLQQQVTDLQTGKPAAPVVEPVAPAIPQVAPKEVSFELSDEDFDELSADKAGAAKVLSRLVNSSNKQVASQITEQVMQLIPQIVAPIVARNVATQSAADAWKLANPDLASNPKILGFVQQESNRLSTVNPTWAPHQIFDEAGKSIRSLLGKKKPTDKKPDLVKKTKPPAAKKGGAKQGAKKTIPLTRMAKELSELTPGD